MSDPIFVTSFDFDEQPEIDQYRETHIEYAETFNCASKSLNVETYMTFKELCEIVREVLRDE